MKSVFQNSVQKKVTKPKYCKLFSLVGKSNHPMSKYEIEEAFANEIDPLRKSKKRYVYRMIKNLTAENPKLSRRSIKFLDVKLREECSKRISELSERDNQDYHQIPDMILGDKEFRFFPEEDTETTSEIEKMCWQSENRRYVLNFRGFLAFLYGESKLRIPGSENRIREVLFNPSIIDQVPFLRYWRDFEEMDFDTMKMLMAIIEEFKEYIQDPRVDSSFLRLRVTERYYNEVSTYFYFLEQVIFIDPRRNEQLRKYNDLQIYAMIKDYRLTMLQMQKELLSEQLATVERSYEMYSRD